MLDFSKNKAVVYLPEVDSTNKVLQNCLSVHSRTVPEGAIIRAGFQTQGKGQQTNVWESEKEKNLMISMVLYPDFLPIEKQFLLSKAVSLGIVNALSLYSDEIQLKWPNDIYFREKKLGGILIETAIMGPSFMYAVVGFGLNVHQKEFKYAPNAISLSEIASKQLNVTELLEAIRFEILVQYRKLSDNRVEEISSNYLNKLMFHQKVGRYKDEKGNFSATLIDVQDSGLLVLRDSEQKKRSYWMKEVEFILGAE